MLLDLTLIPSGSPFALAPALSFGALFFWSIQRPDVLGPLLLFTIGLGFDLVAGLPPGLTIASLLLLQLLAARDQPTTFSAFGPARWLEFIVILAIVFTFRWMLACIMWAEFVPVRVQMLEFAFTATLYPPLAWVLARIQAGSTVLRHAPGH
jgi:rod shape-determining protein MreD